MEPLQGPAAPTGHVLPHIVQVYHSTDNTQQIIHISHPPSMVYPPSEAMTVQTNHVSLPHELHNQQLQSQIATLQPSQEPVTLSDHRHLTLQTPVFQNQDLSQVAQQSVVLPHILLNSGSGQYYGGYQEVYQKAESAHATTKLEPEVSLVVENKQLEYKAEAAQSKTESPIMPSEKKQNRSPIPNPSKWACNIRKLKHQRGEAYISRRGKHIPERKVKTTKDCLRSCKYKCSAYITDTDREHLFKAFYSLSSNEKKHFLLNTTERTPINRAKKSEEHLKKRQYSFKYFFLVRAVRYTVCKNFYLGTLAISQKPVYNVHLGKSEMNIPKPDGRGTSEASTHTIPSNIKDRVRKHIMSFKTLDSKNIVQFSSKKQYLNSFLSIKQMYKMYADDCMKNNWDIVKESMYRKIMKLEFNLHFRKVKVEQQLCAKCKGPVKKENK